MPLAERYVVASAFGRSLTCFCQDLGIDVAQIAAELGIDTKSFHDTDSYISLLAFGRLLECLADRCSDDMFGLRYGRRFKLGDTGPFGLGMMNAPSLAHAIGFFVRYVSLTADYNTFKADVGVKTVVIEWTLSPLIPAMAQYTDMIMLIVLRQFRLFAGQAWMPQAVRLQRAKPSALEQHQKEISPNLKFGAETNAIEFSSEQLQCENPNADHRLFEIMDKHCQTKLQQRLGAVTLEVKVRQEVLNRLQTENLSLSGIACHLGMSDRSLQRRLAEAGLVYEGLLDQIRMELSEQLMRESKLTFSDISDRLGYSTPSVYSRAARRWYGLPATEMRNKIKHF